MFSLPRLLPAVLLVPLFGCKSYQAAPLIPEDILREIERARDLPEGSAPTEGAEDEGPSAEQLAGWLLQNSPALRVARAKAVAAGALADVDTPLPNPTLAAGPLIGLDLPAGSSGTVVPMVEFGFSVPLTGRLGYQDEVNALLAEFARTELIVAHRHALLKLRELMVVRVLTHRRLLTQQAIVDNTRRSAEVTRSLVEAGTTSGLDVGLMELEVAEAQDVQLGFRGREIQVDAALSSLIGIAPRHLGPRAPDRDLPPTAELPDRDVVEAIMLENHPELALIRARYAVAEKRLRLEIAKQYPDLDFGAAYEGDPGSDVKYLGLALGISLPIFDRNQQGIVVAEQERETIRTEYAATLSLALASLEAMLDRYQILTERRELLEVVALPRAEANVDVATRSIQAGEVDVLRVLEVKRRMRALLIEILEAEEAQRVLAAEIEQLIGWPLVELPSGAACEFPSLTDEPHLPDQEGR